MQNGAKVGLFSFMANENTRMLSPAASAPSVTDKVAKCAVCGVEWQVKSPNHDDAKGCSFCDAPESAITISYEGA
jgi:hypothetical protein